MDRGVRDVPPGQGGGRGITRRDLVVGALACAVWACLPSARGAGALEASGDAYATVSGVPAVDESLAFGSLAEAFAAVAACDPAVFEGVPGYTVHVHGVLFAPGAAHESGGFDDGLACALVGASEGAGLACADGFSVGNATGALILSGLALSGRPAFSCRDALAADSCSFEGGAAMAAGGDVAVTGCSFSTVLGRGGTALDVALSGEAPLLSFSSNAVLGFAGAVSVSCGPAESLSGVSFTSNTVQLAPAEDGGAERTCAVRLEGGPWPASSLLLDGNDVVSGGALVGLAPTFQAAVPGRGTLSVAASDLDASAIAGLFEYSGVATSSLPAGLVAVALSPSAGDGALQEQVDLANAALMPELLDAGRAAAGPAVTVSYDANGATAGSAPEPATVAAGEAVVVEGMGSLAFPGAVFQGWNTSSDGTGVFYAAGQVFVPESDTVLYAQWSQTGTVANVQLAPAAA